MTHRTKQEIHGGSPWHRQKHAEGLARATAMLELRRAGFDDVEIARRFKTSINAVKAAIKRYEDELNGG